MITPLKTHDELLHDISSASSNEHAFHLWWLGQSGFLLKWQTKHLLFDPYLSDSLTKKYAETDKPHVRMIGLCIDPARLDFIDVVTSSHNHTDHLDAETLIPLLNVNQKLLVIAPEANRRFVAQRLQLNDSSNRLVTCDAGCMIGCKSGLLFHAVPAAHENIDRDEEGCCHFVGYVVQFGPWTVYHSGDTVLYDGMVQTLRRWPIDVAILPINGRLPERRVAGNLWGREAAQLAHDIGAKLVVPCHYDMFEFNTATPDEFVTACEQLRQPYRVLQCGERLTVQPRLALPSI